jgi:hypothetical protein
MIGRGHLCWCSLPSHARWRGVADGWLIRFAEADGGVSLTAWFSRCRVRGKGEAGRRRPGLAWRAVEWTSGVMTEEREHNPAPARRSLASARAVCSLLSLSSPTGHPTMISQSPWPCMQLLLLVGYVAVSCACAILAGAGCRWTYGTGAGGARDDQDKQSSSAGPVRSGAHGEGQGHLRTTGGCGSTPTCSGVECVARHATAIVVTTDERRRPSGQALPSSKASSSSTRSPKCGRGTGLPNAPRPGLSRH